MGVALRAGYWALRMFQGVLQELSMQWLLLHVFLWTSTLHVHCTPIITQLTVCTCHSPQIHLLHGSFQHT